jgi:hypothetical protein
MTPGRIKQTFGLLMDQMPARIETITDYLFEYERVRYSLERTDEELDLLPLLIAKVGRLIEMSDDLFEANIANSHPGLKQFFRQELPRTTLSSETHDMIIDGSLLWGEIFRHRYPRATWQIGAKPRGSIDYGWPVLRDVQQGRYKFNPYRYLNGQVLSAIRSKHSDWTLNNLTKTHAHSLGIVLDAED